MVPDPQIWSTPQYTMDADIVIPSLLDFRPELFHLPPFSDPYWYDSRLLKHVMQDHNPYVYVLYVPSWLYNTFHNKPICSCIFQLNIYAILVHFESNS